MNESAVPVRRLGLLAATAIVIANMIGTGVFTTTGFMAGDVANPMGILIGWLIGGAVALSGAFAYAELGAMMPRVGGEYVYLRRAFAPWLGFLSGWVSLFAGFSAPIAVAALAFSKYGGAVVPVLGGKWSAVVLIGLLTAVHAADVAIGSAVQTVFTVAKVALILVFIGAGVTVGDGDWSHFTPTGDVAGSVLTQAFAASLIFVYYGYSGWNAAAYVAGEMKNPGRNLPLALIGGTAIVTILYLGLNSIYIYAAPVDKLAGVAEVGHLAATQLFGETAGNLLSSLIALALISAVSAMVMAGPRVYAAMAEDGAFFRIFAARTRRNAPIWAIVLQSAIAIGFVLSATLRDLINYVGFTLSIFAAMTVAAVFVLRLRAPDEERPYRTFGYPITPLVFVILCGWMVVSAISQNPRESLFGAVTVAAGILVYAVARQLDRR